MFACLLLGVATSIGRPALSAMLLHRTPDEEPANTSRRRFVLMNAGAAYGGLAANLHDQQAMHRLYPPPPRLAWSRPQ